MNVEDPKQRPTVGVSEHEIVKGLLRALQREVHDGIAQLNADIRLLVEQGRLLRDRVATLETRVAIATESAYASHERDTAAPKTTDLTATLARIEATLSRLEGKQQP